MKQKIVRWVCYLVGMAVLAVGLTLNTKTGLGVSAILSVPFGASEIWDLNFGNATLVMYILFILAQMLLHIGMARKAGEKVSGKVLVMDALQLPLSIVFTRVINLVSALIPMLSETYPDRFIGSLPGRILVLLLAVVLTGIGAAMTLNMRIVPNPSDGMVQVLSEAAKKKVGTVKNCFDLLSVCVNLILGFVFARSLVGVGIGTIIAALGIGRVIALFNRLCKEKMCRAAGL